jgi:hypothetical protein
MTTGRYAMRGRVFQPRAFAGWALANGGTLPPEVVAADSVRVEFRSRTSTARLRSRSVATEFRSRTITIGGNR